ncbi:MAG: hypothetical protein F6K37_30160 [Moorea sp. SIO4E2]|uniref:hypothetical protein n=1 Tax=Moorena sp. SIO4E2 TaxID=2607826 RepID=UPI0013B8A535|nr:hypothetical protein [Moorena sp. SIO4E2]NEQ10042.1 hypothetical protein [Moorena sp. SIO4E2]
MSIAFSYHSHLRSHFPTTAICDRIFPPQPSAIAFSHHSHLRSHFPTTAICDRIFPPQPSAIAFSHHSHLRSHFPTTTDSRFPIPTSRFPIPNSQFSILNSQFSISCSIHCLERYFSLRIENCYDHGLFNRKTKEAFAEIPPAIPEAYNSGYKLKIRQLN